MINLRKPTEATILDGTITAAKLADGAVDLGTPKVTGQAPATKIADGAIIETKIAPKAVTTGKIADEAIDDTKLANGSVTDNKLADNAVTAPSIRDNEVVASKLAPNSVTETKIAIGAVDLESGKVIGELPNDKLAIIEDVEKLKDGLVTLAKTTDDVKLTPFVGGEVEQSVTGTTEEGIIETGMSRISGKFEPKKIRIIASLKVSADSGNVGTINIYADDEVAPRLTLTGSNTSYELVSGEFDVSDLIQGRHKFTAKMKSSLVAGIAYNDYMELYTIK